MSSTDAAGLGSSVALTQLTPATRIVRRASPELSETPLDAVDGILTPTHLFYVRNHFADVPAFDAATWRLRIGGLVDRPLSVSLDELRSMPRRELICTVECAGNGGYNNRLRRGAVSTARWRGVALRDVLLLAAPIPSAAHVIFRAADTGVDPDAPEAHDYERSLPIARALDPDTLLSLEMNGAPLRPEYGAPLRLIVPGWYGMDAVKWLESIRLAEEPSDGFYMTSRYRAAYTRGPEVRRMVVKSAIARPTAGARLPLAACTIEGVAWAGEAGIARVDVSADGGRSWRPAELLGEGERWTWRLWRLDWLPPSPGRFTLIARAWDRDGRAQPFDPRPGELGRYAANAVERVPVTVED